MLFSIRKCTTCQYTSECSSVTRSRRFSGGDYTSNVPLHVLVRSFSKSSCSFHIRNKSKKSNCINTPPQLKKSLLFLLTNKWADREIFEWGPKCVKSWQFLSAINNSIMLYSFSLGNIVQYFYKTEKKYFGKIFTKKCNIFVNIYMYCI